MDIINFSAPTLMGNEVEYINDCLRNGKISENGNYSKKSSDNLKKLTNTQNLILTNSCTSALEIAAQILGLKDGDEVIVPGFTFVTSASAFCRHNAKIRFADIDLTTLNVSSESIQENLSSKTKAVVLVHYAGRPCDFEGIKKILPPDCKIVEDAAQSINSFHEGRHLGTIGSFGAFSFHNTKNITAGLGGALILKNSKDLELAEMIRDKGTNRSRFLQGQVDKYTWEVPGSAYAMSELSAAMLLGQLEKIDDYQAMRNEAFLYYERELTETLLTNGCYLPVTSSLKNHNSHIFYFLAKNHQTRNEMLNFLHTRGVSATFHYLPLQVSNAGMKYGSSNKLPNTIEAAERIVRLPLFNHITEQQSKYVVQCVKDFFILKK